MYICIYVYTYTMMTQYDDDAIACTQPSWTHLRALQIQRNVCVCVCARARARACVRVFIETPSTPTMEWHEFELKTRKKISSLCNSALKKNTFA